MRILHGIGWIAIPLLGVATVARGDGERAPDAQATPNRASDASFDKRLPPVFPGETVNDSGKKIKVWSTSGPVPVSTPPEPFSKDGKVLGNGNIGVGVIIDRDAGRRGHSSGGRDNNQR